MILFSVSKFKSNVEMSASGVSSTAPSEYSVVPETVYSSYSKGRQSSFTDTVTVTKVFKEQILGAVINDSIIKSKFKGNPILASQTCDPKVIIPRLRYLRRQCKMNKEKFCEKYCLDW